MREPARDKERLQHILDAIQTIEFSRKKYNSKAAEVDPIVYYGFVKHVEIIGEAAYMLTKEFCAEHPETPWKDIIGMRHVLVHGYYTTSKSFIWATIQQDLPALRPQIEAYIVAEQVKRKS